MSIQLKLKQRLSECPMVLPPRWADGSITKDECVKLLKQLKKWNYDTRDTLYSILIGIYRIIDEIEFEEEQPGSTYIFNLHKIHSCNEIN